MDPQTPSTSYYDHPPFQGRHGSGDDGEYTAGDIAVAVVTLPVSIGLFVLAVFILMQGC